MKLRTTLLTPAVITIRIIPAHADKLNFIGSEYDKCTADLACKAQRDIDNSKTEPNWADPQGGICVTVSKLYNETECERRRAIATAIQEEDRRAKERLACDKNPTTIGVLFCRWSLW